MKRFVRALPLSLAVPLLVWSQAGQGPYAGEQARRIKSLSESEVRAYLDGRGMGLAKPAELNSYPGPMHVLELAEPLGLSAEQRARAQESFARMRGEATRLGKLIVEKEAKLNDLFAERRADQPGLRAAVKEIARLQGELRVAHLGAHLEMRSVLTPEQVERYDELRGYAAREGGSAHGRRGRH